MNYPQTEAAQWSAVFPDCKRLKAIANFSCLAMVYLWVLGIEAENVPLYLKSISNAIDEGLLDDECTVLNAEKFLESFSGRSFKVLKKDITSIKNIKKPTAVRFDYNGHSHWVGVENGKIAFNSLANSVCVSRGKPTTARIVELRG